MVVDWIALVLQAAGGAIADTAATEDGMNGGTHILVAGLSFQVLGLILFMLMVGEYVFKVKGERSRKQAANWAAGENDIMRNERKMRYLCYGMDNPDARWVLELTVFAGITVATVLILIRSIFRVAELAKGFQSKLANEEVPFMILEGAVIILATTTMTICHPGLVIPGKWKESGWELKDYNIAVLGIKVGYLGVKSNSNYQSPGNWVVAACPGGLDNVGIMMRMGGSAARLRNNYAVPTLPLIQRESMYTCRTVALPRKVYKVNAVIKIKSCSGQKLYRSRERTTPHVTMDGQDHGHHGRDTHAMPPQAICDAYKKYQRMSDAAVNDDLEIVDFNRGLTPEQQEKMSPVGIVPSELIAQAQKEFMNTGAEYDSGYPEACTIYEHSGFPAKNQFFTPKDPNSKHKPLNAAQALQKKLRWLTLGSQYNWNTRAYPSSSPTPFPTDISHLVTTLFQNAFTPESGVVLLYSTKDFMPVHRDVSEECERGLASFTLGCDGLFVISRDVRAGEEHIDDREQDLVCIRVRSGDVIQMGGETRWAWHAMPKIMGGTCPPCLAEWPVGSTEEGKEPKEYERWRGYMKGKRLNISCRQVWN
ncbi:hypothetical protein NHQ30_009549 [Ciborinia camelliae]|nr:hypothetical protein NHQ30_009549 [Ciborinia camelliae]